MKNTGFPDSRALSLADKPLLDSLFAAAQPRVSEMTFAGLWLFRRPHDYRLATVGDSPVVLGRGYAGGEYFLPPLGGDVGAALDLLLGTGMTLYGADDLFAETWLRRDGIVLADDRDNADYLYLRRELAELPGSRFHKKKNRVNYFSSRHDHRVELYSPAHRDGCLALLDEWAHHRAGAEGDSPSFDREAEAAAEALETAETLGLEGVVVLVAGNVRAFALGERLNRETSVCHFQKADPFMDGLYQLVDREFNRLLFTDCTWVNREQDLGEPGLRQSKLSYQPVELVRKWRAHREGAACFPEIPRYPLE